MDTQLETTQPIIQFLVVGTVGTGLLFLRKWAAIYFSIGMISYGLWFTWTAIVDVRFPFNLIWMCEGISFMLPLFVTIRVWRQLTWGGKWFF